MAWFSNPKHKVEEKSTKSSRSSSKVVGLRQADLWGLIHVSTDEHFPQFLCKHGYAGHSCQILFVWIWTSQHADYKHVLFHNRLWYITRAVSWGPDCRKWLFSAFKCGIWTPHSPVLIKISAVKRPLNQLTVNKANLRDLIAATSLIILLTLDSNNRFFSQCDLEIWWMTR